MNCVLGGSLHSLASLCALVGVYVIWGEAMCPEEGLYALGSVFVP